MLESLSFLTELELHGISSYTMAFSLASPNRVISHDIRPIDFKIEILKSTSQNTLLRSRIPIKYLARKPNKLLMGQPCPRQERFFFGDTRSQRPLEK